MNDQKKYKVVIVDDHLLFASSLEKLIATFSGFEILYKVGNGLELQKKIAEEAQKPDIVLLDVKMPIMNGFETSIWLKETHPDIKVLILSMEDEEDIIIKMIRNGAKGYLLKDINPRVLNEALNEIATHGFYYTDKVNTLLTKALKSNYKEELELKEQEITFLKLACTEKTYKEIAEIMCLSPKTIDGYRHDLFTKLSIKNRVGLVLFAMKHNYID